MKTYVISATSDDKVGIMTALFLTPMLFNSIMTTYVIMPPVMTKLASWQLYF